MKRFAALIFLLLCALALLPCAMAEDSYVPGETARQLIAESWNAGKIIRGDMKLRLKADASALGLDKEEAAILEAILPVLDQVTIGLGAGKTESGIRVEADAYLAHAQGGEPVTVSAAANLDLYGVCVESDLIPGQRVTSRWETLMAMAGMNDSDISMLLMLRDMGWDTLIPQMIEAAETYGQMALEYAQPYADIIVSWAAALPMTLEEGPAPAGCPEGAIVSSVTATEKDVMNLAAALAEYLKNDTVVSGLCDLLIQEFYVGDGETPTVAQLCDEAIAEAAACTNTRDYFKLTFGVDAAGAPVYFLAQVVVAGKGTISLTLSCPKSAEGLIDYAFSLDIVDYNSTQLFGFTCSGKAGVDLLTASARMTESDTQIMGMEYSMTTEHTGGTLPGQKVTQQFNMAFNDGESSMQMIVSNTQVSSMTIDGGEVLDITSTSDVYADGVQTITTSLETLAVYPDTDGFTGSYSVMENMPAYGVDAFGFDVHLSDKAYDPATTAALAETALETSSRETIDALLNAVMVNGQYKLIAAMQALPTEVLSILMSM